MNPAHEPTPAVRRGFTLTELAISVGIMGVVLLAGQSAVMLASAASTRSARAATTAGVCAATSSQIADDLTAATAVTTANLTSITCVVPDRTGDSISDTITYSWSGTHGDPLLRAINSDAPNPVLSNVQALSFEYVKANRSIAIAESQGAESLITSNFSPASRSNVRVKADQWVCLAFKPTLPEGVASWSITQVKLYIKQQSTPAMMEIQIRRASGGKPVATPLASVTVRDTDLTTSSAWRAYAFNGVSGLSPSDSMAIVAKWIQGNEACEIDTQSDGTVPAGDALYYSADSGSNWIPQTGSLMYEVYGRLNRPGTPKKASAFRAVRIRATVASPDTQQIAVTVPFANDPAAP